MASQVGPVEITEHRSLPYYTQSIVLIIALVLAGSFLAITDSFNLFTLYALAVPIYLGILLPLSIRIEGRRYAIDRLATGIIVSTFALALFPLISVLQTVITNGAARFDVAFFTQTMHGVFGDMLGGSFHAIVGTLIITAVTAVISIPIGVLAAVFLVEYGDESPMSRTFARALRFFVDVMTGIPSIVAGLFAYSVFSLSFFYGVGARAGFIGAVALTVLMIPIVVRNTEEMLQLVARDLREASYALGVPKWRTILKVVIPTASGGIATGVTLAIARVIGETAPLLVTVGTAVGLNLNPFSGRMATLPYFTYISYMQPGVPPQHGIERAWAGALVLILLVMALNLLARLVAAYFAPKK
ncbi:phosphate ABC transporter permease PstA [Stomatohabitans albus]|uniref:phosphate ABC transporter permease PstA n=1 Tax=Stomatohabitans albus TaxID=3110766 RepID=UPI003AB92A4A